MNNFTYRSNEEKDNLEAILKQRRRKFNSQQWIARLIIIVILGSLVYYAVNHTIYTDLDGYVHVDENSVRAPFDLYVDSVYVNVGDIVNPGDTLYSYYMLDLLVENSNPYKEPAVLSSDRDLKIKYQNAMREANIATANIKNLRKQIAAEEKNISFGLGTVSHKMDLERKLNEERTRLNALWREVAMLSKMRKDAGKGLPKGTRSGSQLVFDDINSPVLRSTIRYHLSSDSSLVTNVFAPDRVVRFKKENILETQHLDLEGNNLSILGYVPIDRMHNIATSTKARIIVDRNHVFDATVSALGLRTDEIPENLRSYFAKKNVAPIVLLKFDEGQEMPFWCLASGLPVTIRIKNYDLWRKEDPDRGKMMYITGKGVDLNNL